MENETVNNDDFSKTSSEFKNEVKSTTNAEIKTFIDGWKSHEKECSDLIAITMCYTEDGITSTKVVGIFDKDKIFENISSIKTTFANEKILHDSGVDECGITYFEYNDEFNTSFYTGVYTVNELCL